MDQLSTTNARYHHGDLRRELFDMAETILEEVGAEALSLRELARRAGVSPRAPYRHYPDKEALLSALATAGFVALKDTLAATDAAAPKEQALAAQAGAYVRFAFARPARFRLMFGPRRSDLDGALAHAKAAARSVLAARVAADAHEGEDVQARVLGCWSFVHGLTTLFIDGRIHDEIAGSDDEIVERVTAATLASSRRSTLGGV